MDKIFVATKEISYAWKYDENGQMVDLGSGLKVDLVRDYQKDHVVMDGDRGEQVHAFRFHAEDRSTGNSLEASLVSSATSMSDLDIEIREVLVSELGISEEQASRYEIALGED